MAASAYHVNLKEVKNWSFRHNFIFRHIHINNPYWLELPENFIRASWEIKKERSSYIKKYIEEFVWGTSFFLAARPLFYVIFCHFFCLLPPFRLLQFYEEKNIFAPENRGGGGGGGGGVCVCVWGGGWSTALYLTQCRTIQWKRWLAWVSLRMM